MAADWKARSETISNLVSDGAIVVGGIWVLYQWDTMFPKTSADVQTAAASVRTDVSGTFAVRLGMGDDFPIPFLRLSRFVRRRVGACRILRNRTH